MAPHPENLLPRSPTEVIALGYDPARNSAPQVVAKGAGHVGETILQLAREHDIPLHQDPELTRLLGELELGDEIPEQLYKAIAQVILFAWELSAETSR